MYAYLPQGMLIVVNFAALIFIVTVSVNLVERSAFTAHANRTLLAWSLAVATCVSATLISFYQPAGVRMIVIILATLVAIKAVALGRVRTAMRLHFFRWLTFVWLWPGMNSKPFEGATSRPLTHSTETIRHGCEYLAAGIAVVVLSHETWVMWHTLWISEPLALIGISLSLHFGFLNIVTGVLRHDGVDVEPVFNAPLKSKTLQEFWGRRWNLAFNDMTSRFVFMPVARRSTLDAGLIASFCFSGLLHEMAISLPTRADFGLPFVYFLLHGVAVVVERRLEQAGHHFNQVVAKVWVLAWLLIPLPLVFNSAFLAATVQPIFQ